MPDFIDIDAVSREDLQTIMLAAAALKKIHKLGEKNHALQGRQIALLFEKPSTRTRASFEAGMYQLGGHVVVLNAQQTQMGRGESIADTARVLSRYVDLLMIRCFRHETLQELADYSDVPVINGLTDYSHPCQIMADILTFTEHRGSILDKTIAWIGDGNNMTTSWIHAAVQFGFHLKIATPEALKPADSLLHWAKKSGGFVEWTEKPEAAASGADLVTTDTWVSMGDEDAEKRHKLLASYQVNSASMKYAKPDALFMHCLPAHRGEEVTVEVIDGPQSVIFDEAENRLHVQKAIMLWCLNFMDFVQ
jgi:ornithine carbamoyltransferase